MAGGAASRVQPAAAAAASSNWAQVVHQPARAGREHHRQRRRARRGVSGSTPVRSRAASRVLAATLDEDVGVIVSGADGEVQGPVPGFGGVHSRGPVRTPGPLRLFPGLSGGCSGG